MTVGERNSYFAYKKHVFTDIDVMSTAREEGLKEGMAEGKVEGKIEVAREMLSEGLAINLISKFTGLSEEEINDLQHGIQKQ
jgi:predicted transposase/invertase (TIGR01784 family)